MPSTSGDSLCLLCGGGGKRSFSPPTHVCIKINCFYTSKEKLFFKFKTLRLSTVYVDFFTLGMEVN